MLMPCAQFKTLKACCKAQREGGINSDESTFDDNDNTDNAEEAEDSQVDLTLVETRIRKDTINMFKRVLLFSQGVAVVLYNNQMITTLDVL
jgi:hypothetical protein